MNHSQQFRSQESRAKPGVVSAGRLKDTIDHYNHEPRTRMPLPSLVGCLLSRLGGQCRFKGKHFHGTASQVAWLWGWGTPVNLQPKMGSCQNYGPFLGTLNNRCRTILGTQKGTIILTTTQNGQEQPHPKKETLDPNLRNPKVNEKLLTNAP